MIGIEKVTGYDYTVKNITQNTDKLKITQKQTNQQDNTYSDVAVAEIENPDLTNNPNSMLQKIKEEIEAIKNYDGFLLGIDEQIEQVTTNMQFKLEDILKVEERIAQLNDASELGAFTLQRILSEAYKALRCQANTNSEKVLNLITKASL